MQKFYLKSMGCKSNQFEGQIVAQNLVKAGYEQVQKESDAEFYILNSCSVTHKSDDEAMYLLRHAHSLGLKTVLTGCIAQIEGENGGVDLLKKDFIDYVFGNEDKFKLAELLQKDEHCSVKNLMSENEFYEATLEDTAKTRMSLKIQDGCDNRCSYCIIPFGRGKSRSAKPDFIIHEINRYADIGYKEVVLTGIHIGLYEGGLLPLLQKIEKETTIPRYRLGSLNPHEITEELLDFLQTSEKFCPHFHLSLQSACNTTLKRMNRHYTVEYYLDLIENIVSRFDKPFLGSDIIAGFVGETEEEFQLTVENLNKSKLSQIHVFPYSVRKGTAAEKMEGHLSEGVKEKRANIIKRISAEKFQTFLKSNIGSYQEVLVEKHKDKKTGLYKGITRNYINVLLENGEFNTLKTVKLTQLSGDKVIAK